jgi:hypothetical protein
MMGMAHRSAKSADQRNRPNAALDRMPFLSQIDGGVVDFRDTRQG